MGARGLFWSRPSYGRSTPRDADEIWDLDFRHHQAHEVMPAFFDAVGLDTAHDKPWLLCHSAGGSIALLHAARFADRVAGAIALAPHILEEGMSVASIEKTRNACRTTDQRQRLGKHHDDPDSAFWGWCRIWLHPPFRQWSIEDEIRTITSPLLGVQGLDDEYGTLEQIRGIARRPPPTQLHELPQCGHSSHRDQPAARIEAARAFILKNSYGD